MLAVRGLFKGGEVILLEKTSVTEQCEVVVVFLNKSDSTVIPSEATKNLTERVRLNLGITPSELDVLKMAKKGMKTREIAENMNLSDGVIRNYLSSIYAKLKVSNRAGAISEALRLGLLEI